MINSPNSHQEKIKLGFRLLYTAEANMPPITTKYTIEPTRLGTPSSTVTAMNEYVRKTQIKIGIVDIIRAKTMDLLLMFTSYLST